MISGWIDHFNPFSSLPVRCLPRSLMKAKVDLLCFAFPGCPLLTVLCQTCWGLCASMSVLAQRFMKWDNVPLLTPIPGLCLSFSSSRSHRVWGVLPGRVTPEIPTPGCVGSSQSAPFGTCCGVDTALGRYCSEGSGGGWHDGCWREAKYSCKVQLPNAA